MSCQLNYEVVTCEEGATATEHIERVYKAQEEVNTSRKGYLVEMCKRVVRRGVQEYCKEEDTSCKGYLRGPPEGGRAHKIMQDHVLLLEGGRGGLRDRFPITSKPGLSDCGNSRKVLPRVATLQLLKAGSSNSLDNRTPSSKLEYIRVWMANQIYDCWVQTMFPSSPTPSTLHTNDLIDLTGNTTYICPSSTTATGSGATTSSSVGVINLTRVEDVVGSDFIDFTEDEEAEMSLLMAVGVMNTSGMTDEFMFAKLPQVISPKTLLYK
ncbi:hypothetical protein EV702DRAFT_1050672 [Suillus placidus]|uniref:Uncharacterized protein n=1 Tax=Suillus placidus TaxID=48579 RepID=A0A9P7CXF8_9AGAM|nr:hypothetical protein EV702DRAFT_1050672 [Suillus placidus]